MVHVHVLTSADDVARTAAAAVAALVRDRPRAVLGVATGSTPIGAYRRLAALAAAGELDASGTTLFALDEYVGLPADHPAGYRRVVMDEIAGPLGIPAARVHVPDGDPAHLATSGAAYEQAILVAGGVDLQIAGIGENGHLGFNEPGSPLDSVTRVAALSASTRAANARFFDAPDDVPARCVTQGLGTVLRARRVLLLALGPRKAAAVAAALEGPVTPDCPASILQRHPDATVLLDPGAAADLARQGREGLLAGR